MNANALNAHASVQGKRNRREIWAVDSETDPFKKRRVPRPFIWGAFNGTEYHEFANGTDLVLFLRERNCIAYAHNGGRFDWHYLLPEMEAFSPIMVISGRIAKFRIGNAEFRDSWNIMPMPLRAGGQKMEIEDFSIFESDVRDLPANKQIIRERVRTDCVYLWQMVDTFLNDFGLHLTSSSASMHAWHKISGIEKPQTSREFYQSFAPYYFGGRVECFEPGIVERDFVIIDINSAYTFAMNHKHPWGEIPDEQRTLPAGRSAIQRSFITLECKSRGAFPFRASDGSLAFPADGADRVFHVTGWEYLAALETGALREHSVSSVLSLPLSIDFRSYSDHFYAMKIAAKAAGDAARYEFSKKFLNGLYGKFGSNPDEYAEYKIVPPRFIEAACEAEDYQFCAELGPWALLSRGLSEERQRYYNVAVAASVTGFIRAYDWRAMQMCRAVTYIDTDCLHCVDTGSLPLDENTLGSWKIEARCNYGAYAGKKLYACRETDEWYKSHKATNAKHKQWKIASKGVKLTHEEIIAIARGEDFLYESDVPQYSVKRGIQFIDRRIRRTR